MSPGVAILAEPRLLAGDEAGEAQRAVVVGQKNEERPLGHAIAPHLALENVDIDVRRGEDHVAQPASDVAVAGYGEAAERLHGRQVPIEWATMSMRLTPDFASERSSCSKASRAAFALSRS